jgi:endoglucanase
MNRRDVLRMTLASAGLGGMAARAMLADEKRPELPEATPRRLPYWRGFNLPVAYRGRRRELFDERDFADVADLGFNFLRLALNYHDWTDPRDPKDLKRPVLKQIDRAVELGKQHGIHLLLDFHIAPGFGQIIPPERTDLWTESEPAELCASQWSVFAERYKGVPNSRLSFNLFNEPDDKVKPENLRRVTEQLVRAIRSKDSHRLIIMKLSENAPDVHVGKWFAVHSPKR